MLAKKTILVCGVANMRSIAWHVAKRFRKEGAQVLLTYQKPEFEKKILSLTEEECKMNAEGLPFQTYCCDVTKKDDLSSLHDSIQGTFGTIDSLFHAIAFAPSSALKNDILSVSQQDFATTLTISSYSLIALTHSLESLFREKKASVTALSFLGSQQIVSGYGVMSIAKASLEATAMQLAHSLGPRGIRMNILRAPPLNTLAARGIPQFLEMKKQLDGKKMMEVDDPMDAVCKAAIFLASDLSEGVTGECINVDSGSSHVKL